MAKADNSTDGNIWNSGAYEEGVKARTDGKPISSAPAASAVGQWLHLSWTAGWSETNQMLTKGHLRAA